MSTELQNKVCKCGVEYLPKHKKQWLCDECSKEYKRNYRECNKDRINDYYRQRRQNGKIGGDAERTYHREYARNNKSKRMEYRSKLNFFLSRLVMRAKRHCEKSNKKFDICIETVHNLWTLQNGICVITKMPMLHKPNNLRSVSIDRIDGSHGYTYGNIQLVCQWVNFARNKYSIDEIITILQEFKNG